MRIENTKLIIAVLCLLAGVLGCQQPNQSMIVIIEGDGGFPSELVGVWKTQDEKWEIEFLPDGSIREALIPLGSIRLQPGETKTFEMPRFEGRGEFNAGQWSVFWNQEQRELGVVLVIDHFYQDVGNHAVEGASTDFIFGEVSKDFSRWTAVLNTQSYLEALLFEGWTLVERNEMADDKEPIYRGHLIFQQEW